MTNSQLSQVIGVLTAMLAMACVLGAFVKGDAAFLLASIGCTALPYIAPIFIGLASQRLVPAASSNSSDKLLTSVLCILALVAYLAATQVISRATEISWHYAKFGDPTVSLGSGAARFFALFAIGHLSASWWLIKKAVMGGTAYKFGVASFGIMVSSCLVYFILGISPFAYWRT